jgi:hypothetical protein
LCGGYGFPGWVTEIDLDIDAERTTARVADTTGGNDLALSVATPDLDPIPTEERVLSLTSYT